jgi:hypothetical protein
MIGRNRVIKNDPTGPHLANFLLTLGVVILLCALCILCLTPPTSKDALIHHLAVPKLYLDHGGIYEIPSIVFSYYPMNLDLLYWVSLHFGNDIIPKLIHFVFALLTAYLIFIYLRRRVNATWGRFGVLLFLSLPIIVKLAITVYVDLGLIFFSTGSLLLMFEWIETDFKSRYLIASAVFCGLAMGTKYNGLLTFFLLVLFVPYISSRCSQNDKSSFFQAAGHGIVFLTIAVLVFSPWMVRNFIWTGNPIFPLYDQWINSQSAGQQEAVGIFAYRALAYNESWWKITLLPVRVFFQGQDGNPQYFDGRLNPLLFILPFFAFFQFKRDSGALQIEKKILLYFSVLFFSFTLFTAGLRIRYISPIIPPLVILSIFGAKRIFETVKGLTTFSTRLILLTVCLFGVIFFIGLNVNYVLNQYKYVRPFDYLCGRLSRDEYITKHRPEYPTMQYINESLSKEAYILFLFMGNRGYYCDRKYLFDLQNNKSKLYEIVEEAGDSEYIFAKLKNMGITHLLMNSVLFNKWAKMSFDQRGQTLLQGFFREYVETAYSQNGYHLYILKRSSQEQNT